MFIHELDKIWKAVNQIFRSHEVGGEIRNSGMKEAGSQRPGRMGSSVPRRTVGRLPKDGMEHRYKTWQGAVDLVQCQLVCEHGKPQRLSACARSPEASQGHRLL